MFLENTLYRKEKVGWIEVICGSMFSGKTEELIRRLRRAEFAKQKVMVFKPAVDTRYHDIDIVSHNLTSVSSIPISHCSEILSLGSNSDVVGIDEAQFFSMDLVGVCNSLANGGVRVIVAGLDMDFKGEPFGPMPNLMATAEYVTKVHAICTRTGNLAHYSYRKSQNTEQFMLGESLDYEPLSREAFLKAMKERE